ncbi:MAG TPA: IS110 family transposase [Beijerinckiaceae bacterium]|nr:IS110 family transposase [Beijerinckiaceae bacterium]
MTIKTLGIDLAKNVFQLYGADADGGCVLQQRVRRETLLAVVGSLPPCTIGIEACTGAFFWQRRFERLGHEVKIIAPQYVKPFLKHQKNDRNDAEAICTALRQPNMRFVPKKSVEQQDIQTLHRARQRLVNHRTALVSQMRGILLDRGIGFATSITRARRMIPEIIADADNDLTELCRETLSSLLAFLHEIDVRIRHFDRRIDQVFRASEACQRVARIRGVGPKTATAVVAAVGDGREFQNGRHMAAWLGLVPRQHSSGDRRILMGISKRGDRHLRTLLVHGARAVVRTAASKSDGFSAWVNTLRERRGTNRAIVAVANKNARVIWALLRRNEEFRPAI